MAVGQIRKALLPAAVLLMGLGVYVQLISANASDKNWLLIAARKLLDGKKLYTDIFEVNPPLIVWLYTVPVWISRQLPPVDDYVVLALLGLLLTALVIRLSVRLIGLHPAFAEDEGKRLAFGLLLAFVFVFFTAPMYFFDRENIMLTLTFPYVLRFIPSLARQALPLPMRLAIGLLAGIGFCIKPHALIVFTVLQMLYILRERSLAILWSAENLLIYLMGGLYLGAIVFGMPEYLHTILPMALATYSAYSRRANGIYNIIIVIVILGITFADFRPRKTTSPMRREIYYFLGVCGAYLLYALFNNGWSYTYQPLFSTADILVGWVLLEFLWLKREAKARGQSAVPFDFGVRACVLNLFALVAFYAGVFVYSLLPFDCNEDPGCTSTKQFFDKAKGVQAHSFGVMTLEFYKWSELARETGEKWDTRFNHLWMLPKFILSDDAFARKNQWIIDYVGNAYAQDMKRWKPDVMYIDTSPELFRNHPNVDLTAFFSTEAFREEWKHYTLESVIDSCIKRMPGRPQSDAINSDCRFSVYRRIPSS